MNTLTLLMDYLHIWLARALPDETGEGVISAAIAVLVMAFLGAAMWVAFNAIFTEATDSVAEQVKKIGG
jgi:uncharacterized membrane protein (DUF485 family)